MSSDWWFFSESETVNLVNSTAVFIALGHNLCLLLFLCYQNKTDGMSYSTSLRLVNMCTYSGFVFYNSATVLISVKEIFELLTCTYSLQVVMIAYTVMRYMVWLFSLMRIKFVFHIKVFKHAGYTTKTLKIIFIILTLVFIQNLAIMFITTSGKEVHIDENNSFCAYVIIYMPLVMYLQLADQWCTIGCFILFWKKMRWVNKFEKSFSKGNESDELKFVLRKCTILLATNLLSSWFLMIFLTFTPLGIMAAQIDSIINMWTIVLFEGKYDKIYTTLFHCIIAPKRNTDEVMLSNHVKDSAVEAAAGSISMIIHSMPSDKRDSPKHAAKQSPTMKLSLVKHDSLKVAHQHPTPLRLKPASSEPVPTFKIMNMPPQTAITSTKSSSDTRV